MRLFGHERILNERREAVKPSDVEEWIAWMQDHDPRVADSRIGKLHISTVFLGYDPSWISHRSDEPTPFETLVFGDDESPSGERYPSWEAAELGHARIVETLMKEAQENDGSLSDRTVRGGREEDESCGRPRESPESDRGSVPDAEVR